MARHVGHGLGLYALSMHLSRIDVEEGQHVAQGEPGTEQGNRTRYWTASALGRALAAHILTPPGCCG